MDALNVLNERLARLAPLRDELLLRARPLRRALRSLLSSPTRRQRLLARVALLSMVLGAVSARVWISWRNMATVANAAPQEVEWIELSFGGERRRLENLAPGSEVRFPWRAAREGGLCVRGSLSDGTPFAAEGAFVSAGGFGEDARVVVEPAGTVRVDVER